MKNKIVFAILGMFLLTLGLYQNVSADQFWIILHHEDQGRPNDMTFEDCRPLSAWNGHEDHTGDWRSDELYTDNKCENVYVPPTEEPTEEPTDEPTPTLPPTEEPTQTPVVTSTPSGPNKDVPTCYEMSKMSPEEFESWLNRWQVAGCEAKGYQTGSGNDSGFNFFIFSGVVALLVAAFWNPKKLVVS